MSSNEIVALSIVEIWSMIEGFCVFDRFSPPKAKVGILEFFLMTVVPVSWRFKLLPLSAIFIVKLLLTSSWTTGTDSGVRGELTTDFPGYYNFRFCDV